MVNCFKINFVYFHHHKMLFAWLAKIKDIITDIKLRNPEHLFTE